MLPFGCTFSELGAHVLDVVVYSIFGGSGKHLPTILKHFYFLEGEGDRVLSLDLLQLVLNSLRIKLLFYLKAIFNVIIN